jgi:hypothetical protein
LDGTLAWTSSKCIGAALLVVVLLVLVADVLLHMHNPLQLESLFLQRVAIGARYLHIKTLLCAVVNCCLPNNCFRVTTPNSGIFTFQAFCPLLPGGRSGGFSLVGPEWWATEYCVVVSCCKFTWLANLIISS